MALEALRRRRWFFHEKWNFVTLLEKVFLLFLSNCDAKTFSLVVLTLRKNTKDFPHFHFFYFKTFSTLFFALSLFSAIFFRGWNFFLPHINSLCAPRYEKWWRKKMIMVVNFSSSIFTQIFFDISRVSYRNPFQYVTSEIFRQDFAKFH